MNLNVEIIETNLKEVNDEFLFEKFKLCIQTHYTYKGINKKISESYYKKATEVKKEIETRFEGIVFDGYLPSLKKQMGID